MEIHKLKLADLQVVLPLPMLMIKNRFSTAN